MIRITAIKPQKKEGFFNIFLDGQFSFSLSLIDLSVSGLKVGDEISEKEVERFSQVSVVSKMTDRVLRYLTRRPHSRFEVENYLKRKFFQLTPVDEKLIAVVLSKVGKLGLIDDEDFASWLFDQRAKGSKAKGLRFIKSEFYKKGIPAETTEKVFSQKLPETDWKSLAAVLVAKKKVSYKDLPIYSQRQKLLSFLLRRGFDYDNASSVVYETLKIK